MHEMFFCEIRNNTISVDNEIVKRLGKLRDIRCYIQQAQAIWITTELFSKECEFDMEISRDQANTEFKLSESILKKAGIEDGFDVSVEYREFSFAKPAIVIKSVC